MALLIHRERLQQLIRQPASVRCMSSAVGAGLPGILSTLFTEFQKKIIAITVTTVLGGVGVFIFKSEKDIAACIKNGNDLEREYSDRMYGHIELVKDLAERCQDRWPEAIFLEPVEVSKVERDAVWRAMQDSWVFWKKVKSMYEPPGHVLLRPGERAPWRSLIGMPLPNDAGFFTRNWAGRGKEYRKLFEPVDIANWYYKNKHLESGHYADGITDELKDDNSKRPGRYLFLAQQEARVWPDRMPASSLGKAYMFETLLGDMSWQEWNAAHAGVPAPPK